MKKQIRSVVPFALLAGVSSFPYIASAQVPTPDPASGDSAEVAIAVKVNGEQVPFATQGPLQRGNAILVPLRGVFEKLGAEVKFDAETKTITATKGLTTIVLHIGDVSAGVNGEIKTLTSAPEVIGGATMVPLRFVSEALGASVKWDTVNRIVEVTTDAVVAQRLPEPPLRVKTVNGTITGVYPEADAISLRVQSGENRRLPLAPGAVVHVIAARKVTKEASVNSLRIGDLVRVQRDNRGQATVIELPIDERQGVIKAKESLANGNILLRLTNGTSVEVLGSAPVELAGRAIGWADLKVNEGVVVRVNPETGIGIGVAGVTGDETRPTPPEGTSNTTAPLPKAVNAPPVTPAPTTTPSTAPAAGATTPAKVETTSKTEPKPAPPPAAGTETKVAQKPEIQSVTHDAVGKILKGGETVTVTVVGTPKGEVAISVPKLFNETRLPLMEKEDTPGTYTGTFTTPFNTTALDITLTATLKLGEETTAAVMAEKPIALDASGPELSELLPKEGTTVSELRPKITGTYRDEGTKVNPKAVRLYVNDEEVTDKAEFTETTFSYTPTGDLKEGPIKVAIAARDTQGNETSRTWMFTLKMPEKPIRRLAIAPTGVPLRANDVLHVRMEGMAGGKAMFHIETMEDQPMVEESPGVYTATYTVKAGDSVTKGRVLVSFTPPGGEDKILREAPDTITLRAVPPAAPVVTSPKPNDGVKSPVVFTGTTEPYNTIRISFAFEGKQFLSKAKGTLPSVEVRADENGNWKTEPLSLEPPKGLIGVTFSVDVVAISVVNQVSPATNLKLKKK